MYLKCLTRFKDGKEHHYYSLEEKVACTGGRRVQRRVFYLGEINDSLKQAWLQRIEAFDLQTQQQTKLALFASGQPVPPHAVTCAVQVRLAEFTIRHARQWGACWVFLLVWEQLQLEGFWREHLPPSREGTSWYHLLVVLCAYRLIDPGSEWRLHRDWYGRSAMADVLGGGFRVGGQRQSLSVPGQVGESQDHAVHVSAPALAGPLRGHLRRAALRSDQHVFRE